MLKRSLSPAYCVLAAGMVVLCCAETGVPRRFADRVTGTAWSEEQVEEGLGHLNALPGIRAPLPR